MSDTKQVIIESYMKLSELKGKKEMVNKYSDVVKETSVVLDSIFEHTKKQEKEIQESARIYLEQMRKRTEQAKEFCGERTSDELKEYLANQPVAYNLWKNADHDTLVSLVMDVYEL